MSRSKRCVFWLVVLWLWPLVAAADSPLTSTQFAQHYPENPAVKEVQKEKQLTPSALLVVVGNGRLEGRLAVLNALGFSLDNKRAWKVLQGFATKLKQPVAQLKMGLLSADDLAVLAYAIALGTYHHVRALQKEGGSLASRSPQIMLQEAMRRKPSSFVIHLLAALVKAQGLMRQNFCSVYQTVQATMKAFPAAKRDMKSAAVRSIMKYILLYKSSCKPAGFQINDPKFNQIYKIARYEKWIVTGSQAGVVFFNPQTGAVDVMKRAFITNSFAELNGHLWVGAHHKVMRFDGHHWKILLKSKRTRGFHVSRTKGPQPTIQVRAGKRLWRYSAKRNRLVPAKSLTSSVYARATTHLGTWNILFMNKLVLFGASGRKAIPLQSQVYPGSDPRRFYVAPGGQLWVVDFHSGFFFFDEAKQTFSRVPVVSNKGSAMAVDPGRKRHWFLHYTDGLHLIEAGKKPQFFNLHALQYMRDLFLDKNGDVWVAGWNQLLRLYQNKGVWQQQKYKIGK